MSKMPSHTLHDSATVRSLLIPHLPRLVEHLFSDRVIHRSAHEYRIGRNGSISIRLSDGSYYNHETGEGGDIFALIQHVLRTDFSNALRFACSFVGNAPLSPTPSIENQEKKRDERAAHQRDKAIAMLKRSIPIKGTIAETYLRQHRGICMTLSHLPTLPRFIAHAYNHSACGFYPAMIAAMRSVDGDVIAAHCTFLDLKTDNKVRGDGIRDRLIFGSCKGGAIRLAEATDRVAVCEGIEDGLSIMQCSDWPVWVTGGTSNMRAVKIPVTVHEVMVCADSDEAGIAAAHDLAQRLVREGKRVRIATPPAPYKDFNDMLRGGGGHAS